MENTAAELCLKVFDRPLGIEERLGNLYRIRDARLVARAEKVRRRIAELRQERLRRRGSTLPA